METSKTRIARHHLIGLGFWQAWQMVVLCTEVIVTPEADQQGLTLAIILATTVGYLVIMAASHFTDLVLKSRAAIPMAAASMSGGTFILMLASAIPDPSLSIVALVVALIAVSYGNAALLFMWGELWSTLATGRVGRHLYLSYAFAFIPFFLCYFLPYPAGGVLCCLFPIASCVILVSCASEPCRKPSSTPFALDRTLAAKAICFIILLSIIWGSTQHIVPQLFSSNETSEFIALSMLVAGVALGAFALSLMLSSPESETAALYRPIVPCMAIGMTTFFLFPDSWSFIGNGLLTIGIYCLDMLIMLASTDIAFRARIASPLAFGIALVSSRIGTFLGSFAVYMLPLPLVEAAPFDRTFITVAMLSLAILVIAGMIVFTQADLQSLYVSPYSPEASEPPAHDTSTTTQRCQTVAEAAGLTARETEVLELLVRGRTVQGLCEELSIAQGTAKHHVSNIYRKLGVGDRRSVFDIVERAKPSNE